MIDRARLTAPPDHLGILVEPSPAQLQAVLRRGSVAALDRMNVLDRSLGLWRAELRRRLGHPTPIVVTGHQVEFFHAGVLAKTIAAQVLAARAGGTAVFLTVDSDQPKSDHLTVPQIGALGVRRVDVLWPACDPSRPVECQPLAPRAHWLDFFVRVASLYEHYDASLLREFADAWLDSTEPRLDVRDAMGRGWAAVEAVLGVPGVRRLRISALCEFPEFRAFAAHLLLHAPRLAQAYNGAQAAYRRRHRVRTVSRPVPPLAIEGGRTELPLWVFRCDEPRQRLYVADAGERLTLHAGSGQIGVVSRAWLADPANHAHPWALEREGWRLRPRALTLSAFARLFLADLFLHGIGGAKYDEMTDEFAQGFFGAAPSPIGCVSATLHLPLPHSGVLADDVRAARRQSRDLVFNPHRYVREVPAVLLDERAELVRRSNELRAQHVPDRAARRSVFEGIRRLNDRILSHDPWRAAEFDQRVQSLSDRWQLDRIALDREYFAALHVKRTLDELVAGLRERLRGA